MEGKLSRLLYHGSPPEAAVHLWPVRTRWVNSLSFLLLLISPAFNPSGLVEHICMWLEHVSGCYEQASPSREQPSTSVQVCYLHQRGL